MDDIAKILKERGFFGMVDDDDFLVEMAKRPITVYIGFDPSAKSLHAGNLLALMGLLQFQRAGHTPIALIGGATGLIGDPSGKSEERNLLDMETAQHNQHHIQKQIEHFLPTQGVSNPAIIVNNFDWITKLSFIDFLRDIGKHFRVNEMVNKDSVKRRLEGEQGISLTEFCYMTIQSYDFFQLNKQYNCEVQSGGMDQWGNIAAGIDLVRRLSGKRVHGLCFPLMLKADGTKFGKTEAGAIWLDPEMTSPFEFYQFWIRSTDADVLSYLKHFTLLDIEKITEYEKQIAEHPEKRVAQKALAYEATLLVHGETEAVKAREASEKLFSGNIQGATDEQIQTIFPNVPSTQFARDRLTQGLPLVDVLVESGLCKGKGDARRQIKAGGVYVNDVRCQETDKALTPADTASDHFLILRKGKKNYHLVQFD